MMYRNLTLSVLLLTVASCTGSMQFGRSNNPNQYQGDCRVYVRGARNAMPPLPKLDPKKRYTDEALALLQAEYISNLREWFTKEREREDEEYYSYIRRCVR